MISIRSFIFNCMSSIRQSSDQFLSAFTELPIYRRAISLLLSLAIIVGFVLLIRSNQTTETEYLFGGRTLGEQEIDSLELTFSRAKLSGWQRDGRRIKIPTQFRSEYLATLDGSAALPISLRSSVQEAIDKANLFEPTSQQLARRLHAKERDLGNKLTAFAEIRWASVEHDLGERSGLSGERTQSASVVVCPEGDNPLPPWLIEMIRELIRGSYAGMRAEEVVVIDTNADPSMCRFNDPIARKQCEEEARLEHEVQDILRGYGPIRVAAYVELQGDQPTDDPAGTPTIVRQPATSSTVKIKSEPRRTLLGEIIEAVTHVSSNRATRLEQPDSDSRSITKISVNKVSPDELSLSSVRLSIGIPESYYQKLWQHAYLRDHSGQSVEHLPPLSTAKLAELKNQTRENIAAAVRPAVISRVDRAGPVIDESAATIDVWSFPDFNSNVTAESNHVGTGLSWARQTWQPITFVLLAGAVLWVLFAARRPTGQRAAVGPDANELQPNHDAANGANAKLSQEVASLVDQHPDLAADVIRNWIAEAA